MAFASPRRWVMSVEPTMSVKRIVRNAESALKAHLSAARGMEVDRIEPSPKPNTWQVHGKVWHAIDSKDLGALSGVMDRIPVKGEVTLGPRGEAERVDVDDPSAPEVAEAISFLKSLKSHGQIAAGPDSPPPGATHQIEADEQGRRKLTRKRFSAR